MKMGNMLSNGVMGSRVAAEVAAGHQLWFRGCYLSEQRGRM